MRICVYEDAGVAQLHPLTLTRPAFDLRCGAGTLLERLLRALGSQVAEVGAVVRPEMADLTRLFGPADGVNDPTWMAEAVRDDLLLVNARWLAPPRIALTGGAEVGTVDGELVYVALPAGKVGELRVGTLAAQLAEWERDLRAREVGGVLLEYPWDVVTNNARALEEDFRARCEGQVYAPLECGAVPPSGSLLGPVDRLLLAPGATVEPLALLDTTSGPVIIDHGARVQAFSRLSGPCYVGPGTHILGGKVQAASFGPHCRIGGEVEYAIVQGYSNKAHDGFLGHSYLGEWVNLGAGTHTSDLRNDYSTVTMLLNGDKIESGLLKVGSFIGDHTKTSIGTLFNTGSVIGPFGQLVTTGTLLPRYLPSFCQIANGRVAERTDLGRMFMTAATAMGRRQRAWTEAHVEFFLGLYERTATERRRLLSDGERKRRTAV